MRSKAKKLISSFWPNGMGSARSRNTISIDTIQTKKMRGCILGASLLISTSPNPTRLFKNGPVTFEHRKPTSQIQDPPETAASPLSPISHEISFSSSKTKKELSRSTPRSLTLYFAIQQPLKLSIFSCFDLAKTFSSFAVNRYVTDFSTLPFLNSNETRMTFSTLSSSNASSSWEG